VAKIPGRNQLRAGFADKPVVFVGVNSGNPKNAVEQYAKSNKFEWPILVDEARETEKQLGFTISLQNIYQSALIDPAGKLHRIGSDDKDMADAINRHLPEAKFLFDGVTIPDKLKPLARDLELGLYEPGVAELAAVSLKTGKDQPAAQAMYEKFKPIAEGGLERAKAFEGEGKKYAAYVEYAKVAAWFKKTDYEKAATAALAPLKKDKEVQDELNAKLMLDQAKALLASSKKAERESAPALLAALKKKYPNTEAAKDAEKLAK
jgi:hypothetical protein